MKLKTYHAYTMAEALAGVRRDLGADAVILNTRTFKRRGWLGLGRRTIVEVTATPAKSPTDSSHVTAPGKPAANPMASRAQRAYSNQSLAPAEAQAQTKGQGPKAAGPPTARNAPANSNERRTQRLAMAVEEAKRRKEATNAPGQVRPNVTAAASAIRGSSANQAVREAPATQHSQPRVAQNSEAATVRKPAPAAPIKPTLPVSPLAQAARRFILQPPDAVLPLTIPASNSAHLGEDLPVPAGRAELPDVKDELAAIKSMISHVLKQSPESQTASWPKPLLDTRLKLLDQDLSEQLIDQIMQRLRDDLTEDEQSDPQVLRMRVVRELARVMPVAASNATRRNDAAHAKPFTIALIGPTGVGKTTTVAKLAAMFKLRHQSNVGLITADTYRIAAVDQLRTYAEIIGIPLHVALTPDDMSQAVRTLSDRDIVLIDTAGRSQNDTGRLDELREFIAAAAPHEVHLVLSATAGERVLLKEAEAFMQAGVQRLILTKLDEAVTFGPLVNVVRDIGKPVSFITTGQEVPDHIEVAKASRLAELALGAAAREPKNTPTPNQEELRLHQGREAVRV